MHKLCRVGLVHDTKCADAFAWGAERTNLYKRPCMGMVHHAECTNTLTWEWYAMPSADCMGVVHSADCTDALTEN